MYLAVATRPDLAYIINYLSQFSISQAALARSKACTQILERNNRSRPKISKNRKISGFTSDWASDSRDRRSYSDYYFVMTNAAVTWESKKQKTTASNIEVEYMFLIEATKEAIYLRGILQELGVTSLRANKTPYIVIIKARRA